MTSSESDERVEPLEIENDVKDEELRGFLVSDTDDDVPNKNGEAKSVGILLSSMLCLFSLFAIMIGYIVTLGDPTPSIYPPELLENAYSSDDFRNKLNFVPPYWNELATRKDYSIDAIPHMGPCFLPETKPNWNSLMEKNNYVITSEKQINYRGNFPRHQNSKTDLAGLCRPGFLIIGAGKCGTSSLYHYLVGHPRVLPAKTKQIHYFKYFTKRPMKWYLENFPPAETFLSNGALMTGEASPGYMPYPDVANRIRTWMETKGGNGEGQEVGSPKIISIVRNPLERSWSSYKYNYRQPLIDRLRKEDLKKGKNHSDEWYVDKFVFSFDDLITAELKELNECLKAGGRGEMATRQIYGDTEWATLEYSKRSRTGLPALISIDETCYGKKVSKTVPRRQWKDMVEKHPDKIINVKNLHLVQSLVGRSLYSLPLEWWYALYPKEELYLFCNEDLRYNTSQSMSTLSDFLGLPTFDFTNITKKGMYNMGGNTGYDEVTNWNSITQVSESIQISDKVKKEYLDFVEPYNERLFDVAGKRCNW